MANVADTYMIYQVLKRLTTPFEETKAFELGLIDKDGKEFHFRNIGHYQKNNKLKVQLVKRSGTATVLGQGVFTQLTDEEITGGSGQFDFSVTSSLAFNDLVYLRVIGLRDTTSPQNPSAFTASINSFKSS